jgi:hypothetical protein
MVKTKLQDAVRELRKVYHDAIESQIRNSAKSYAQIGLDLGCSEQLVYQVARERGLRRNSQQSNNQPDVADESRDAGDGGSHE